MTEVKKDFTVPEDQAIAVDTRENLLRPRVIELDKASQEAIAALIVQEYGSHLFCEGESRVDVDSKAYLHENPQLAKENVYRAKATYIFSAPVYLDDQKKEKPVKSLVPVYNRDGKIFYFDLEIKDDGL